MGKSKASTSQLITHSKSAGRWKWALAAGFVLAILWAVAWWQFRPKPHPPTYPPVISPALRAVSTVPSAEAAQCSQCHRDEVELWRGSQHANAQRLVDPKIDLPAFRQGHIQQDKDSRTVLRVEAGVPSIAVTESNGSQTIYHPEAVIGVTPLIQYLTAFPGGRLQVFNLAFDPLKKEWFDAQAPEIRVPQDWSHWKNRGMNWNSQCAFCHTTNLRKGYNPETDSYATTWDAMGISCKQCHGAMDQHIASPKDKSLLNQLSIKQMTDNCASCHARREELTGNFHAGEVFEEHYRLALPSSPGVYYPDGQVREEDFEFGSFSMSRMGHKGVTCLDCHNPHSGKLRLPVENNALCMSCHTAPGQRGAIPIDPATHSHHQPGTPGDRCVDCHMPQTRYMVRDPRRDHGFTIPDPVLTKELGVPNSCNRCHADQSTDWSIEHTMKWYGDKMERRSRQRARVIDRAEKRDSTVMRELLAMAASEEINAWRSVLIDLLGPWAGQPEVRGLLEKSLKDESPLVRSAAVRLLGTGPETAKLLQPLCDDPIRMVRLDAIWNLHRERDTDHASYRELKGYLATISDQPAGALRQTQLALEERRIEDALKWSAKAAAWDATSGAAHQVHAVVLNAAGRTAEAITELQEACELEPTNPENPFMLALVYGEVGNASEEIIAQLKKTVAIDPGYGRAWYNLGLAFAKIENFTASVDALKKAEELLPESAEVPYARATVHARAGQIESARAAARRAQSMGYAPASELLKQLPGSR